MGKKSSKPPLISKMSRSVAAIETEKIVNAQTEAKPRLKAARDALRRSGTTDDSFVQDTLTKFRQRLKT